MRKTVAAAPPSPSNELDPVLISIERAMNRIRRRQSRRALGNAANEGLMQPIDLQQASVVDAVEDGTEAGQEITVGDVADRLGIDPSRASRVVAASIKAGYIRRVASQLDGRRICLELTDEGRQILNNAHRFRRALYDRLLDGWSDDERAEFARLLTKFTAGFGQGDRS
jgi:DNA-binding MarR family transcriptional regulator